jgi:BirA family biotin operon repressor/biotin-[acetyl-CoA-carboxylase] ligase
VSAEPGGIRFVGSVTSTNDVAWEEGRKGALRFVSVVADRQTGGRGRAGRAWDSPEGKGLYASSYVRLGWSPELAAFLTLAAGLAVRSALAQALEILPGIKWPNDLIAPDGSGRKLGGILTETRSEGGIIRDAVIGIGVNLRTPVGGWDVGPEARPVALDAWIRPEAIPEARALAGPILRTLQHEIERLESEGPGDILERARTAMPFWGRRVRGEQGTRVLEGTAKDLAPDGGLVIRLDSGSEVVVHAGDVRVSWEGP